jgi:hypothetical protein
MERKKNTNERGENTGKRKTRGTSHEEEKCKKKMKKGKERR